MSNKYQCIGELESNKFSTFLKPMKSQCLILANDRRPVKIFSYPAQQCTVVLRTTVFSADI
jgi:hypothetical protein